MHKVKAKGILSANNGMNIYRGCTHGCIYCDSRSKCYQMDHDFTDIEVKENAPELLADALSRKRKKCMIGTGSMTDPYLHLEQELKLTRRCIEIIAQMGFGLSILTKSAHILRDLDLLKQINGRSKCVVQMTLTTYDEDLCRILEPGVSTTRQRFEALKVFRDNGIPTVVWISPLLPYINDTEENIRGLLDYCLEAKVKGIICYGIGLTLRDGSREFFYEKLDRHFPGLKEKYMATYKNAYEITSPHHRPLMKVIRDACRKNDIIFGMEEVFAYLREFDQTSEQISFF
ncbi:MAG: radical SAM protein [Emergencia timonensis]|uniref:SPL family radical SAM protein n=1 Tax=Emergencia timonensis TaxID=1776384 RepID=UPI00082AEAB6|nr:radical SAM protein [Emergencia timonensis]WNX88054.1 radical SAM protein [Emergencia timonensis]